MVAADERKNVQVRDGSTAGKSVLDQSFDLLEYLSAVAREIGPKPVRDVRSHPFTLWPSEVPNVPGVVLGPTGEGSSWLEVARVAAPASAGIPAHLSELLHDRQALDDPDVTPRLSEAALERRIDASVSEEFGEPPASDEEDPFASDRAARTIELRHQLEAAFRAWVEGTWTAWAEKARPVLAARRLYGRLYELHLSADVDSATHEVIWGHLVLSCRTGEGTVVAPMLTANVTVEIDPDDATIRVAAEQPVGLELDAVEGTGMAGIDGLVALQSTLRTTPPDPWARDERLAVRGQLIAPLGVDASLHDSDDPAPVGKAPLVNDGWVLFMRKRPLRQERFYDELAHMIQDEEFLPEALASVVADKDRVDRALTALGREPSADDGTADRLMMPLPANEEQERIARQLARARGVTVQGPPGTGKSHTIVNLVSHLVAQGKRVLVTAEKEQALSVLRDKIPDQLRDLSIAVLGSTPAAMEDLRSAAQSMQDSLSAIDTHREERRIAELGSTIDSRRDSLHRIDAALVEALRSEQREYKLPTGPARAPEVAEWLVDNKHLDVVVDQVPTDAPLPVTPAELVELANLLRTVSAEDALAAILDLPVEEWLPSASDLASTLERLEALRAKVTALAESGLRIESLDLLSLDDLQNRASGLRDAVSALRGLSGEWEDRFGSATRGGDTAVAWVIEHNPAVRAKLAAARELANRLAGHVLTVPDGNPGAQLGLVQQWAERLAAGKKISLFASKELKEFGSQVQVDGYPVSTIEHLELVKAQVQARTTLWEAHTLMTQAYAPCQIPVPVLNSSFLFAAEHLASRVDRAYTWWSQEYPELSRQLRALVTTPDPALRPETLESVAGLFESAAARLEERRVTEEIDALTTRIAERSMSSKASPLWSALLSALQMARPDSWGSALDEARRLLSVRAEVLRSHELAERIDRGGAPRWARAILESRGDHAVVGAPEDLPISWERAKARTWLTALHSEFDVESLMNRSHTEARELRDAIVDMASRSARVQLKKNLKDRQRRALETWLTAVKRVGKGTGKNAPRFQAAAREALPAAMGAVPIWIMPIYRVMENFDPRVSDLFDVVVVDESSQCDLLSLGVLALGKKSVVVGDDKQTTPERVGVQTDRIAALQDLHLRDLPEAKLLTLDESLYSISGRAFPSTIALKEHFRCVPEVIGFSNRYYNGAIQPLREVGVPQIGDPLKVVHVDGAISVARGSSRVNIDEATAIADQIAACVADSAYDGLTFGVVTMMSGPQAQIIQDLIRDRIGDEEFEHRRLRVGNPPLFQGDERNVMFVSMVAHDNSFAATTLRYAQWANVAVSRAQDQLWIFHSMDPSTLHHEDQRRAMIDYARSYGRRDEAKGLYELTESKFERDVLRQMLERGYEVIPQHRVGNYRIDFVVRVAPGEQLAVECDGDTFHGPDKWDDDVRRQRVLERLGWSFWRVRASAYYLDPEVALKPLWDRLEEMKARAAEAAAVLRARQTAAEKQRLEALQKKAARTVTEPVPKLDEPALDEATAPPTAGPRSAESPAGPPRSAPLGRAAAHPVASDAPEPSRLRAWARENGYSIGDRGRISQDIVNAYRAAQRPVGVVVPAAPEVQNRGSRDQASHAQKPGVQDVSSPSPTELEAAWKHGVSYQLDAEGDILQRNDGRTLASVIGRQRASTIRDRMRAIRPHGGRFKVDEFGIMVTLVDSEPTFVTRIAREEWFPGHWS